MEGKRETRGCNQFHRALRYRKQHAKQCPTCMPGLPSTVQAKPKLRTCKTREAGGGGGQRQQQRISKGIFPLKHTRGTIIIELPLPSTVTIAADAQLPMQVSVFRIGVAGRSETGYDVKSKHPVRGPTMRQPFGYTQCLHATICSLCWLQDPNGIPSAWCRELCTSPAQTCHLQDVRCERDATCK